MFLWESVILVNYIPVSASYLQIKDARAPWFASCLHFPFPALQHGFSFLSLDKGPIPNSEQAASHSFVSVISEPEGHDVSPSFPINQAPGATVGDSVAATKNRTWIQILGSFYWQLKCNCQHNEVQPFYLNIFHILLGIFFG